MTRLQLQREIQEGLITLLIHAGLPENREQPYTVITTSPSQWLPYCSSDKVTILDVSELVGSTEWHVKADAKDRLLEKIRTSGWSEQQIMTDTQLSDLMSRLDGAQASKIRDRIDIGLLGDNQHPIAVIGLYLDNFPLDKLSKETQSAAQILGAPFAITTNGEQLLLIDIQSKNTQILATFPSPQDLGISSILTSEPFRFTGNIGPTIIRCDTSASFIEALAQAGRVTSIIDYTLPWGDRKTDKASHIRDLLPEPLRNIRQLDSYAALMLLVATQEFTSRLISIGPHALAHLSIFTSVRAYLVSIMSLIGIIELPSDLFSAIPISSSILVLDAFSSKPSQKTMFLSLSNRGDIAQVEDQSWFPNLIAGLQGKQTKIGFHAQVKADDRWAIAQHHPESRAIEERIKRITPTATIGELCDIILGVSRRLNQNTRGGKEIPVIRGRDISSNTLTIKELDKIQVDFDISEQVKVHQGDILLQRIGTPQNIKAIIATTDLEGAIALDSVIILRPKEPTKFNSALIKQFLQSMVGRNLLSMRTSSTLQIYTNALRTVPIPMLPPDISVDLDELQKLENNLRLHADKIEAMRLGLFNAESTEDFRNQLRALRQTSQAITASIQQAESTDFQIRNFYPYPLVYPYRTLVNLIYPQDQYMEQLRIAENILAFLGSLTLALIPTEKYESSGIDLKSYWQGGISPGHWREICQKGANALRHDESNGLSVALSSLQDKKHKQFREDIEKLIRMKNDFKHDRGPKIEEDFQEKVSQASDLLKHVMYTLSFLTEYPIHLVRDVDLIRGTRRVIVKTLRYTGDHPGLQLEQREYPEALKKGDLYIQIQASRWVSLFPFVTVHNCPNCKSHETYFIDYWNDQKAKLKSFERGHTQDDSEAATELNTMGPRN